jgi:hypothetical protein
VSVAVLERALLAEKIAREDAVCKLEANRAFTAGIDSVAGELVMVERHQPAKRRRLSACVVDQPRLVEDGGIK